MEDLESGPVEMSLGKRLVGIVLDPLEVFRAVRVKPAFIGVFLVTLAIQLASTWITFPMLSQDQAEIMSQSKFLERLPAEQRAEMLDKMKNPTTQGRVMAVVQSAIGTPIMFVFLASLLFAGQKLFAGDGSFKQVASACAHVLFVSLGLASLLRLPLVLSKGSVAAVTFSPAVFVDEPVTSFLWRALSTLNVFAIWGVVLAGLGLGIVANIGRTKGLVISSGLYVVIMGVLLGVGSIFL